MRRNLVLMIPYVGVIGWVITMMRGLRWGDLINVTKPRIPARIQRIGIFLCHQRYSAFRVIRQPGRPEIGEITTTMATERHFPL